MTGLMAGGFQIAAGGLCGLRNASGTAIHVLDRCRHACGLRNCPPVLTELVVAIGHPAVLVLDNGAAPRLDRNPPDLRDHHRIELKVELRDLALTGLADRMADDEVGADLVPVHPAQPLHAAPGV